MEKKDILQFQTCPSGVMVLIYTFPLGSDADFEGMKE